MFVPEGPLTATATMTVGERTGVFRQGSRRILFTKTGAGASVRPASVRPSPRLGCAPGCAARVRCGRHCRGVCGTGPGAGGSDCWASGPLSTCPRGRGPQGQSWALRLGAVLLRGAGELPPKRCSRARPQLQPSGVKGQSSLSSPTRPPCLRRSRKWGDALVLEAPSTVPSFPPGVLPPTCPSVWASVWPAPQVAAVAGG